MKKYLLIFVAALLLSACCTSCVDMPTESNISTTNKATQALNIESELSSSTVYSFRDLDRNSYGREQLVTEASQSNFNKNQPPKLLKWSLERENLNARNKRWNDPNKISYIYLLSDMGTCVGYFPIKGKVSSVNSKLTTNQQLIKGGGNHNYGYINGVVESPSMDGSYGSNGDAVFFFLTDGTYMEWAGKYLLCDNYVKLSQQPLMTYSIKDKKKK